MKTKNTKQEFQKNLNPDSYILKTGYRALFLLLRLMKAPMTRSEILALFKSDEIIKNTLSKDSVTNSINTLREAGCEILRPSLKTKNHYILKSHPFECSLLDENVEALQYIRESTVSLGDWELSLKIDNLYSKIAKFAVSKNAKETLLYNSNFKNINKILLKKLLDSIKAKRYINICYYSPENGDENLYFLPTTITYESNKLYLWGYSQKYDEYSYLRIDRIKKINAVSFFGQETEIHYEKKEEIIVEYMLKNLSAVIYLENADEKIISKSKDKDHAITVRSKVSNKFSFFQKILSYGQDCKILSPQSIIDEYKEILENIKSGYYNEEK